MNTFVFNLDEIDVIKKEVVLELNSKKNSNNQYGQVVFASVMNLDHYGFESYYYGMEVLNYSWYSDEKFKPMDLSLIYHKI